MLKIYINNEEVVANNDFTINKHMLNTPSVILNNVCPKEWKENKDYSSFYHPQDYSKCKIQDETYIPAEPGTYTTITGSATIQNVSASKLQEVLQLDGDTTQETTTGANIYYMNYADYTYNNFNGTNITSTHTGYSISGTCTSNTAFTLTNRYIILPAGTYTMKLKKVSAMKTGLSKTNYSPVVRINAGQTSNTFTLSEETNVCLTLEIANGTQYNEANEVMIYSGTTDKPFEPYTNGASPNPTYPQPVNVVSGRQEVKVVGKNLFNKANITSIINGSISGDVITSNAISSNYGGVSSTISGLTLEAGTYYISLKLKRDSGTSGNKLTRITLVGIDTSQITMVDNPTITNEYQIYSCRISPTSPITLTNIGIQLQPTNVNAVMSYTDIMVSKDNNTTYEAYKGQSYEINLGKNLLPNNNTTQTINGITFTKNDNGSITLSGTSNAVADYYLVGSASQYVDLGLSTGTYNLSGVSGGALNTYMLYAVVNRNGNLSYYQSINTTGLNISAQSGDKFRIFIRVLNNQTPNTTMYPQLELGTKSSYAPYKTPIELCKIGNYQDHIFKAKDGDSVYDNLSQETKDTLTYGNWYIEKQIGKVVLNGSETWNKNNDNRYYLSQYGRYFKYNGSTDEYVLMSDIAIKPTNSSSTSEYKIYNNWNGNIFINHLNIASEYTTSQWATATAGHYIYGVLTTPTYTEITDEELLTQINSIKLIDGLNNVSITSPYLTAPIYIHYNFVNAETIVDLLFCGVVKNSGKISLNPREPHLTTLQILDFKDFLSSGELDGFVIYQKTILEAIQMVIGNIQDYGFVLGNVNILNPSEVIGAYSTKDKTAYDVFNYLADITQSRWTTRLIDENTVAIDFYDPTLMVEGTAIDYTQSYFENNLIDNMSYNYGSNNYRNKQVMTSNQVYSNISQAQTMVANGYQTQFPTEQPIGKINSIIANNIPMSFATFNEKDMGYVADFYYNPGDNYIESDDLRSTGEIIVIDYVAIVEGRQVITNPIEIDRIEESTGRKGIVSRYETRNDATTSTELQKIGESYIKYKGTPEITITIDSRKNLWEVGQRVEFNAPIEELQTEYMVRTKKINYIVSVDTLFYTYELVSSFNSETEINFFDNQRAKSKGNIGEGEYISRNIDIESTANIIFYDTETTEVQVDGDNELNSILNSPFIS